MSQDGAFTGMPVEIDDRQTRRWAANLVTSVHVILVVGVIVSVILWIAVNADVGALVLATMFAVCAGLMIIRQAVLAERT